MLRIIIVCSLCVMGIAPSVSNATLITHGTFFTDTTTGLDWLNNTPLAGQSYNSVLEGAGGYTTSGWRFARAGEIEGLIDTYVGIGDLAPGSDLNFFNRDPGALEPAADLIALLGINVSFGNPPDPRATRQLTSTTDVQLATQGWYDDETGGSLVGIIDFQARYSPDSFVLTQVFPDFFPANDFHGSNVSAILVRQSVNELPEPATITLLAAGIAFLCLRRRPRHTEADHLRSPRQSFP